MSAPVLPPDERLEDASVDASVSDRLDGPVVVEPRTGSRAASIVALVAVIVAALTLPGGGSLPNGRFGVLASGPLEVRDGSGWQALDAGAAIEEGASLRTVGDVATIEVDGGRLVLAAGAHAAVADGVLDLERGSILLDGPAAALTATVDGVRAEGTGLWRVDAGPRPRVGTYRAEVSVDDGSTELELPAYRQVTVRDRTVADANVLPLRYLATDPFDRVQLADAIRIDEIATTLGRSLEGTYGTEPRSPAFYGAFLGVDEGVLDQLPTLAPTTGDDDRIGPPAEVLVGVVVSDAVAAVRDAAVAAVIPDVAGQRDAGATWGLILQAADGGPQDLQAAADRALTEAADAPADVLAPPPATAPGTPAAPAPAGTPVPTGGGGGGGGSGSGGGGGGGTGGSPSPGSPPPAPSPSPPPSPSGPLAPVDDAVRDLGGAVGGTTEELNDTVGDVVGGVDELLAPTLGGLLGGG
ncbi:MAG: hypothetical protein WEB03_08010 [Nitriliruptor sp.]|uniref:hypothetical protein n=1 Tax=Nitriliruptor sp. TaxID=2448056 RepID=UPI0034A01C09